MTHENLNERILKAGFFYQAVCMGLERKLFKLPAMLDKFEEMVPDYKKEIKSLGAKVFFEQLDSLKEKILTDKGLEVGDTLIWCANIYILTKLGYMENDEYNGTQFMYGELENN